MFRRVGSLRAHCQQTTCHHKTPPTGSTVLQDNAKPYGKKPKPKARFRPGSNDVINAH